MNTENLEFIQLIEGHSRMIFKIAGAYTRTTSDREDLISEIVLQLWRTSGSFKGNCKVSTWVYRVALNTALNFNRKQRNRTLFLPTDFSAGDHFKSLIEAEQTPELDILYQCIDELDEINKAIILLYLDGNPHEEIAEIMGISKTNVGTRIGRIKDQLKKSATTKI
jgi:RNA polymerase sigma factor (sigma-70 family)